MRKGFLYVITTTSTISSIVNHVYDSTSVFLFEKKVEEKFEGTKGVIRSRQSKNRQYYSQNKKDMQWHTEHYVEN